jgi:type IV secretion system protein VirD4
VSNAESSTPPSAREVYDLSLGERMTLIVCLAAVAVAWTGVAGAWLAAAVGGHRLGVSGPEAIEALSRIPDTVADPARAWPPPAASRLPGPVLYWACTTLAGIPPVVAAGWWLRRGNQRRLGLERRIRLGVDAEARMAQLADLTPILVDGPTRGRFILGRVHSRLVATEAPGPRPTGPLSGAAKLVGLPRPVRGAVMLVAPSQAGKSSLLISGLLDWHGPAIASSVKVDLIAETKGWRSEKGNVKVYDPTKVTGLARASWSPLRGAGTWTGAQTAAHHVRACAPSSAGEHGAFWDQQLEILLTGYLWVAANTGKTMRDVNRWVARQDGVHHENDVDTLLHQLAQDPNPQVRQEADYASDTLEGIWHYEDRMRSGIFATVQGSLWPWTNPDVVDASATTDITLNWLLSGANTLYLAAPLEDAKRLAPAIGGLLADLMHQVSARYNQTGKPLDPPLLLILDEVGNTPLQSLAELLSTLSGLGVQIVTAWQSVAQIEAAYGRATGATVIANHRTKIFYSGISDGVTGDLTSKLLGDEQVLNRQVSSEIGTESGRRSLLEASVTTGLVPPHVLREQPTGSALMIHGTIPPAHLITRTQFDDAELFRRASMSWLDKRTNGDIDDDPEATASASSATADASDDSHDSDVNDPQRVSETAPRPSLRQLTGDHRGPR